MASEHIEVCAISLFIREMQIKIMKCHPSSNSINTDENVGKQSYAELMGMQICKAMCQHVAKCTSIAQNFH